MSLEFLGILSEVEGKIAKLIIENFVNMDQINDAKEEIKLIQEEVILKHLLEDDLDLEKDIEDLPI